MQGSRTQNCYCRRHHLNATRARRGAAVRGHIRLSCSMLRTTWNGHSVAYIDAIFSVYPLLLQFCDNSVQECVTSALYPMKNTEQNSGIKPQTNLIRLEVFQRKEECSIRVFLMQL